jgi:hypothetical protein
MAAVVERALAGDLSDRIVADVKFIVSIDVRSGAQEQADNLKMLVVGDAVQRSKPTSSNAFRSHPWSRSAFIAETSPRSAAWGRSANSSIHDAISAA